MIHVIMAAVVVRADCVVTSDPDLLDLQKPHGVSCVTPRAFLSAKFLEGVTFSACSGVMGPFWRLLAANRQGWASSTQPTSAWPCRSVMTAAALRSTNGLWIFGMLRRLVVSLDLRWRILQSNPRALWLADFHAAIVEDNLARSFDFVPNRNPELS